MDIGQTDAERVRALIAELDRLVPKDNAIVRVEQIGGGESFVEGNQRGYMRLGIEFLKAPLGPGSASHIIQLDDPLLELSQRLDIQCFKSREDIAVKSPVSRSGSRLVPVLLGMGCIAGVCFLLIGVGTVVSFIL